MTEPERLRPESITNDPDLMQQLTNLVLDAPTTRDGVLGIVQAVEQHDMHMFAQLLRELRREIVGALTPPEEDE